MAYDYYSGTSAYKLEQYEQYTQKVNTTREEAAKKAATLSRAAKRKLICAACIFFAVAIAYLSVNAFLIHTVNEANKLDGKLTDMKGRNAQLSFAIERAVDLEVVEQKAVSEYGMQAPESYQNVYVDVVQNDYVELANEKTPSKGAIAEIVSGVQAFLEYIK